MRKKYLWFLAIAASVAYSQVPARMEYWFDMDSGNKKIAAIADSTVSMKIDIVGLAPGLHTFHYRGIDSSHIPGIIRSHLFFIPEDSLPPESIRGMEYWFDKDTDMKKYVATADSTINLKIDASSLEAGLHTFHYRGINTSNKPGQIISNLLYVPSPNTQAQLSGAEIWIDNNKIKTVSLLEGISEADTLSVKLDIAKYGPGAHFLSLIPKMNNGESGVVYRTLFFTTPEAEPEEKLEGALMWFDNDCSSLEHQTIYGNQTSLSLDISKLRSGLHTFNLLPLAESHKTGRIYSTLFYIPKIEYPEIVGYRYWIDDNKAETIESGHISTPLKLKLDVASLSSGRHYLYIQGRGESEEWGDVHTIAFDMPVDLDLADWELIKQLHAQLTALGWDSPWDMSKGVSGATNFEGVTSQDGRVTELALSNLGINGDFPEGAFAFPKLLRLDLSGNNLTGEIDKIGNLSDTPETAGNSQPMLEELNLSDNRLNGDLSPFADKFPVLKSLDLHGNAIGEISTPLSSTIARIDISGQRLSQEATISITDLSSEPILQSLPSIFTYNPQTHTYESYLSLILSTCGPREFSWNDRAIWWSELKAGEEGTEIGDVALSNVFTGTGEGMWLMKTSRNRSDTWTSMPVRILFEKGDANFSNGLTIADLQATILFTLDDYEGHIFNLTAADTHPDGTINVLDVVATVNLLLANIQDPNISRKVHGITTSEDEETTVGIYHDGDEIWIDTSEEIGAIRISFAGNVEWLFSEYGLSQVQNDNTVVAYSPVKMTIPQGRHLIGKCGNGFTMLKADAASLDARDLKVGASNKISEVDQRLPEDMDEEFFTPDGLRTDKPGKGVSIRIRNGNAKKIIIK